MRRKSLRRRAATFAGAILLLCAGLLMTGCVNTATTNASCAFIVGNGNDGNNALVHKVLLPGESADVGDGEVVKYIPCNSRNYIIGPKSNNANGENIGDSDKPIEAVTQNGTRVLVYARALWAVNQDRKTLGEKFWPFCQKYGCADGDESGEDNVNSATKGWNRMLGENFPATLAASAQPVVSTFGDEIWVKDANWPQIGEQMSETFAENFGKQTGFTGDLICGSGDVSFWSNPSKPGTGTFTCGRVRIIVTSIVPKNADLANAISDQAAAERQKAANQAALEAAKARYGALAPYWLGLQDTIQKCKDEAVKCIVSAGGSNVTPAVTAP